MSKGKLCTLAIAAAAVGVSALVIPVFAQQSPANPDVLTQLLAEVRGLRIAMEQMSSTSARVQLAMGRLQLQEQRINTMLRRLQEVREQRTAAEREVVNMRDEGAQMEQLSENAQDANERKVAAQRSAEMKRIAELRSADVQRLVSDEAEVSNAVAGEQSRWSDINRTLEELERALGRRQ